MTGDQLPTLETKRLILRPFSLADAADVQRLAGAREVAETTARVPHPYPDGAAETWISGHAHAFTAGESMTLAIAERASGELVGAVGLELDAANQGAELGYWVGVPFWHRGYATEAARAVVRYGFEVLRLHRVCAQHMSKNPVSGRVMQKLGMKHEGRLRQSLFRWGRFEDVELYGLLRDELEAR